MKNENIISSIENELSLLLTKMSDNEYREFIKSNKLLSIYDELINEPYNHYIFNDNFLMYIYKIIKYKNETIPNE